MAQKQKSKKPSKVDGLTERPLKEESVKNKEVAPVDSTTEQTAPQEEKKPNKFCELANKVKENKFASGYLKNRLWINFAILAVLAIANCFAGWVSYILFPILGIMILADTLENGVSYIMVGIPFCFLKPFESLIIYMCSIVLYIIKFYLIYFIKDKGKVKWYEIFFVCLFILYVALPIGPYSLNKLVKLALILIIYTLILAIAKKPQVFRMGFNLRVVSCALLAASIMGVAVLFSPYLKEILPISMSGSMIRFQALFLNTNVLNMICGILISLFAYKIIKNKGKYKGCWIDWTLLPIIAVLGVFTLSKLYLVTLIIVLIAFFIGMITVNWKKALIGGAIALGVIGLIVLLIYLVKPSLLTSIIGRFGSFTGSLDDIMNAFTTGRWNIWKGTFGAWASNPFYFFIGRGLGAGVVDGQPYSAHNAYISVIDQLGIVGTALFLLPIIFFIRDIKKNSDIKISKAIAIPIIVLAIMFLSEDLLFYINVMF